MANRKFRRILDKASGATTYIGPDTRIKGDFSGQDNILVAGKITGSCDLQGMVTIADGGSWNGHLEATSIIIAGELEGEVVASDQIEISATARIKGTLSGASVAVAEGAVLEGDVRISGAGQPKHFVDKRAGGSEGDE